MVPVRLNSPGSFEPEAALRRLFGRRGRLRRRNRLGLCGWLRLRGRLGRRSGERDVREEQAGAGAREDSKTQVEWHRALREGRGPAAERRPRADEKHRKITRNRYHWRHAHDTTLGTRPWHPPAGCRSARGPARRDRASVSDRPAAHRAAARLARTRVLRLPPLRHQHVHRQGVGLRRRERGAVRAVGARRAPVGEGRARRGDEGPHHHREASRRLLPLAQPAHRAFSGPQPVARRQRRRVARAGRCVQGVRPEDGRLPLAVGPQPRRLRPPRVHHLLPLAASRAADRLRHAVRGVVRRRQRRRRLLRRRPRTATDRQPDVLRLAEYLETSSGSCSRAPSCSAMRDPTSAGWATNRVWRSRRRGTDWTGRRPIPGIRTTRRRSRQGVPTRATGFRRRWTSRFVQAGSTTQPRTPK